MNIYTILRECARWVLPYNVYRFGAKVAQADRTRLLLSQKGRDLVRVLSPNEILRNVHQGKRCFILGTGPSINSQDLSPLKKEHCIYMSRFYHHEQYFTLNPQYHFLSGAIHHELPLDVCYAWYQEIEQKIPSSVTLLINASEYKFIQEHNFFKHNRKFFFSCTKPINEIFERGVDATRYLSGGHSIVIMAIQAALFMGFKEIYLMGIDQNANNGFTHFYKNEHDVIMKWYAQRKCPDYARTADEKNAVATLTFINQCYTLKNYAESQGVVINDATRGGGLHVFPKVSYENVVGLNKIDSLD